MVIQCNLGIWGKHIHCSRSFLQSVKTFSPWVAQLPCCYRERLVVALVSCKAPACL